MKKTTWFHCFSVALLSACAANPRATAPQPAPSVAPPAAVAAVPAAAPAPTVESVAAIEVPAEAGPRVIGYFTNWVEQRPGDCRFTVADINPALLTHINYAFARVDAGDPKDPHFKLATTEPTDVERYRQINQLKRTNPKLKTLLSVGGWAFNDPPTAWIFTSLVASPKGRAEFIDQAIAFLREHDFDGLDIDWEYPAAAERGGRPADSVNFTAWLDEFRRAMRLEAQKSGKAELLLTIAAPAGPYFYGPYELSKIHKPLNWINVMTYDYNGSWSKTTGANAPLTDSGPNIRATIEAYRAAGVPASKLVLGMAAYGRSWGGVGAAKPKSAATGAGPVGRCSKEAGSFSADEIAEQLRSGKFRKFWDEETQTPYAYDATSKVWFTYDDARSYDLKLQFLREQGLGGAMFWALDLDAYRKGYPLISQVSKALLSGAPSTAAPAAPNPTAP